MAAPPPHLHLVSAAPAPARPVSAAPSRGDIGLASGLLALGLVPLVGVLFGGRFGTGAAGAGTALAVLAGRELCAELHALVRRRRAA